MYLRARYYDPELGRFISRDPVRGTLDSPLTQNPYLYAGANPVMYTDPSGEFVQILALGGVAAWMFLTAPTIEDPCTDVNPTAEQIANAHNLTIIFAALDLLGGGGKNTAARGVSNLVEQLAMKEIMSNPKMGRVIIENLSDPRWLGWSKMHYKKELANGTNIIIHYVGKWENGILKAADDFKIKIE